jgi:hypothetical protein
MIQINYKVSKTSEIDVTEGIENEKYISVEHTENGIRMVTAFMDNISIKVSPHSGVLHIEKMAGNALSNAISLLKQSENNRVVSNDYFEVTYNNTKKQLVI